MSAPTTTDVAPSSAPAVASSPAKTKSKDKKRSSSKVRSTSKPKSKTGSKTKSSGSSSKSKSKGKGQSKSKSGGSTKARSHSKSKSKDHRSKSKPTVKKSRDGSHVSSKRSAAAATAAGSAVKVKEAQTVIEPVVSARNEKVIMNFPKYTGDDEKLKDRIKTDMRRAPFRSMMKSLIAEEQKTSKTLKGADIRMNRDVPKAIQAEMEGWTKDQLQLCAIAARHAGRNTINADDVRLVRCFDDYASGNTEKLREMKKERAGLANKRMEDRKKLKTDKKQKTPESGAPGVAAPATVAV